MLKHNKKKEVTMTAVLPSSDVWGAVRNLGEIKPGEVLDTGINGSVSQSYPRSFSASLWRTVSWYAGWSGNRDDLHKLGNVFANAITCYEVDGRTNKRDAISRAISGVNILRETYKGEAKPDAVKTLNVVIARANELFGGAKKTVKTREHFKRVIVRHEVARAAGVVVKKKETSEAEMRHLMYGKAPKNPPRAYNRGQSRVQQPRRGF
jgi:hypothetical protein